MIGIHIWMSCYGWMVVGVGVNCVGNVDWEAG